jgi:hypothetical protein
MGRGLYDPPGGSGSSDLPHQTGCGHSQAKGRAAALVIKTSAQGLYQWPFHCHTFWQCAALHCRYCHFIANLKVVSARIPSAQFAYLSREIDSSWGPLPFSRPVQ